MRDRDRTMERIERAFAEAVAAGRFDRAEGWLEVARWLRSERLREAAGAVRTR
jgi:hypothetical protein